MAAKKNEELVKAETDALAEFDFSEFEGTGAKLEAEDLITPYVYQLAPLSQVVADGKGKPGQFYNARTGQVYDEIPFILLGKRNDFLEYTPEAAGNKFVASHKLGDKIVQDALASSGGNRYGLEAANGNQLRDCRTLAILVLDENGLPVEPAFFGCQGTKIKSWKDGASKMQALRLKMPSGKQFAPPTYLIRGKIVATKKVSQRTGKQYDTIEVKPFADSWKNSVVDLATELPLARELKQLAADFNESADIRFDQMVSDADVPTDDAAEAF